MFHIVIEHPPEHEELEVVRTTTITNNPDFKHAVTGDDLVAFQELVRKVPVSEAVMRYTLELVRTSRRNEKDGNGPDFVKKWVQYGASVRAAQYLILGGKARALTQGRYHVNFDDIHALSRPVLRHRVLLNFHAESEGDRDRSDRRSTPGGGAGPGIADVTCPRTRLHPRPAPGSSIRRFSRASGT